MGEHPPLDASASTTHTLFVNGLFYTGTAAEPGRYRAPDTLPDFSAPSGSFAECLLVSGDGHIAAVGTRAVCQQAIEAGGGGATGGVTREEERAERPERLKEVDLGGRLVIPSFVDGHAHLALMGQSLGKVDLVNCKTLADIQEALRTRLREQPHAKRICAKGWLQDMVDGLPKREWLDEVSKDVPIYVQAKDLHSHWLSTSALRECGVTASGPPSPAGGEIHRDARSGEPTGLMTENANFLIVWRALVEFTSLEEREREMRLAMDELIREGYAGTTDMAFDELMLESILRVAETYPGGRPPLRVAAYMLITPDREDPDSHARQVRRAKQLSEQYPSLEAAQHGGGSGTRPTEAWLSIIGIKLITDGVIDSCTAFMKQPYHDGSNGEPIWPQHLLDPVVQLADELKLQCALHAIGDAAGEACVDAVERAVLKNGAWPGRRHRMEHMETITEETIARMGRLGIVASVQPYHCDETVMKNWRAQLGNDHRCGRAFPFTEFLRAGVRLAIGTDVPTAPHQPLPNLHVAVTRRSARPQARRNPPGSSRTPSLSPHARQAATLPAHLPRYALPLVEALGAATGGSAWTVGWERILGRLQTGRKACFVVLSADLFQGREEDEKTRDVCLRAFVDRCYVDGRVVWDAFVDG